MGYERSEEEDRLSLAEPQLQISAFSFELHIPSEIFQPLSQAIPQFDAILIGSAISEG